MVCLEGCDGVFWGVMVYCGLCRCALWGVTVCVLDFTVTVTSHNNPLLTLWGFIGQIVIIQPLKMLHDLDGRMSCLEPFNLRTVSTATF